MTLVVDASVVVALLADGGSAGQASARAVRGEVLVAPHLLPFEVADVLRRLGLSGVLTQDAAVLALQDLDALPVELYPWAALAARASASWGSLSAYDASYVALAAELDRPLLTLDARLARAAAATCEVRVLV